MCVDAHKCSVHMLAGILACVSDVCGTQKMIGGHG